MIDNFSNYLWAIPLKKISQLITNEFSNILTSSARSLDKIDSDRGKEWFNSISQNFLKGKNLYITIQDLLIKVLVQLNESLELLEIC